MTIRNDLTYEINFRKKKKGRENSSALFIFHQYFCLAITSLFASCLRNRRAHGFDLGVLLEDFVAHFAAPAGLFVSAEGERCVEHVVAIDPHGSGAELGRERM